MREHATTRPFESGPLAGAAIFAAVLFLSGCEPGAAPSGPTTSAVETSAVATPTAESAVASTKPAVEPKEPATDSAKPADEPVAAAPAPVLPQVPPAQDPSQPLKITYPQEGSLFPPDSVAPTFLWGDSGEGAAPWSLVIRTGGEDPDLRFTSSERRWRPSQDTWEQIKKRSLERDAEITISRDARAATASTASIHFRTSKDPVNDSLFYREVPLPFITAVQDPSRIRWRFGTVDLEEGPPIVLQNLPVCGNCHSFADNGSVLGLDVDYGNDKGAYAVIPTESNMVMNDEKIITWADYKKEDGEVTFGLLSRVSPDGRYVVSTVKDRSVFVATPEIAFSQLFFPIKGILVVYDRETKKFTELPGADDPKYVQSNAVWSPDGKTIVFARAEAYHADFVDRKSTGLLDEKDVPEFTRDKKPFRYDLYRIPFNDGKGGKAEAVKGASGDGKSNFFPKFSPDGKWIIFCKANSYMLLQPDSELYIIPTQGGEARRLRYNTALMNSWHSWSSNSRWLVFSSKVNTPYTQLFLTHIDEEGNDSPPILLERFTSPDRAANIPEFVNLPKDAIVEIREEFLDSYSFLRAGMANENTGDHIGAERSYRRGLEIEDSPELHNALGWTLFQMGRTPEAVAEYEKAIAIEPRHAKTRNNVALALVELGRLEDAAKHYRASVEMEPSAEIYSDLGFIEAQLGQMDVAMAHYKKALELDPHCASARFNMAITLVRGGDFAKAETEFRAALKEKPTAESHNGLGYVLAHEGRLNEAVAQYRAAMKVDPKYTPALNNLGSTLKSQGKFEEAAGAYRESLAITPTSAVANQLAAVLVKMGNLEDAAKQYREVLSADAGNAEAKRGLASIERKQKRGNK